MLRGFRDLFNFLFGSLCSGEFYHVFYALEPVRFGGAPFLLFIVCGFVRFLASFFLGGEQFWCHVASNVWPLVLLVCFTATLDVFFGAAFVVPENSDF